MHTRRGILTLLLCLFAGSLAFAQDQRVPGAAREGAAAGLLVFRQLVTSENYRQMGFEQQKDIQRATLGEPMADYFVRLDELQRYKPGAKVDGLLKPGQAFLFPVVVAGRTRSSLTVSLSEKTWKATAFGAPTFARLLTGVRDIKVKETQQPPEAFLSVRVPALKTHFVGHRQEGALWLTPIVDDGRFGFQAGASLPAEKALEQLVPAAQKHDGAPG